MNVYNINEILAARREFYALRFLIKFNLFALPMYIMLFFDIQFVALQSLTADIMYTFLSVTGFEITRTGFMFSMPILNGSWGAVINWDCVGWKSMFAFVALVFATNFPMRKKVMALGIIPVIYGINLIRIWFMFYYVRAFDLVNYEVVHTMVWSWGLILVIIALWLIWMKIMQEKGVPDFLYRGENN